MQYYVNALAENDGNGTERFPFRTIQQAADIAMPGDEVIVFPGIYREAVHPACNGKKNQRIAYRSLKPLQAVITGAEILSGWKKVPGHPDVWTVSVSNQIFHDYNPYKELVAGDWFDARNQAHTGDVYLHHKSMYEVNELQEVYQPVPSLKSWDPEFSVYVWCCCQDRDSDSTVFYANFQKYDPNEEEVEISVRRNCFMPLHNNIDYITLSGFTVREAVAQWAPPTAYQDGMIGPHWARGWVIENCEIYESKCCGISLGKYLQKENDNKWLKWKYKDGAQTQRECVCQAVNEDWKKEKIGSHIIRNCNIHDCGQAGIAGHLGGAFSIIENNHIHHINNKQNLAGAEIAGIKLHAAVDTVIRCNHIDHCTRGVWLDWQAQGTRVSRNLFHDNTLACSRRRYDAHDPEMMAYLISTLGEDLFIEVSHGPTTVDNNILLSERAVKLAGQGCAFVHNLIAGSLTAVGTGTDNGSVSIPSPRYTPYHVPHDTAVAGFMTILHGDVRFYNNIFVQRETDPLFQKLQKCSRQNPEAMKWDDMNFTSGTFVYNGYPDEETWEKQFEGYCGYGGKNLYPDRYYDHLPVWMSGNVYLNGAEPWDKEKNACVRQKEKAVLELMQKKDGCFLKNNLMDLSVDGNCEMISTGTLGIAFEPEEQFENPDGSAIVFDTDFSGKKRSGSISAGPFADAQEYQKLF